MKLLYTAVFAMLFQQSFGSISNLVVPIVAPVLVKTFGFNPALVGAYSLFTYGMGMVATMVCGSFILRYGGLRVSQAAVLISSLGLFLATSGNLYVMALSAMLVGTGLMVSTPASSHILAKFSPAKLAPLMFSIKQTGVPIGLMVGGLLIPLFISMGGWRAAFIGVGLIGIFIALSLQPFRSKFDEDREPDRPLTVAETWSNLKNVLTHSYLRKLAFASLAFVGLQGCFVSFFVLYLVQEIKFDLVTAGYIFASAQIAAVIARILWGWLSSRFISPPVVLAMLGFVMTISAVMITWIDQSWSPLSIGLVAALLSSTALSWHGVLFAEIARFAPEGKVGPYTGSVLVFTAAGQMSVPAIFGVLLAVFGNYHYGFFFSSLLTLIAGLMFLKK